MKECTRCHQSKPLAVFTNGRRIFKQCLDCREYKRKLRNGETQDSRVDLRFKPNNERLDLRWLALCEFCPLSDCIRSEGDYSPVSRHRISGCLIYEAASLGISPEDAIDRLVVTMAGVKVR